MDDCAVDGSHIRTLSKHHVIVDQHGTPLAVSLTGGNRHDVTQLVPLVDAIPRAWPERSPTPTSTAPVRRPSYDFGKYRRLLRARGITSKIARRGAPHGSGLGKTRWVVERGRVAEQTDGVQQHLGRETVANVATTVPIPRRHDFEK
ncbi:transposase [Streptomyces sp. NPDC087901]|uniref:transposase n=1 Tax=Streptomyces sp. NPDC087901 TaxID=3365818 RepID=UPI00382AB8FE